jgi:hypothetical protein
VLDGVIDEGTRPGRDEGRNQEPQQHTPRGEA